MRLYPIVRALQRYMGQHLHDIQSSGHIFVKRSRILPGLDGCIPMVLELILMIAC